MPCLVVVVVSEEVGTTAHWINIIGKLIKNHSKYTACILRLSLFFFDTSLIVVTKKFVLVWYQL